MLEPRVESSLGGWFSSIIVKILFKYRFFLASYRIGFYLLEALDILLISNVRYFLPADSCEKGCCNTGPRKVIILAAI